MKLFYNNLDAHDDKNIALAKAKISYVAIPTQDIPILIIGQGIFIQETLHHWTISKIETVAYIILSALLLITIGLFNTKWKFK